MPEPWTVLGVLQWTEGYLRDRGVENARLDAQVLLADTLGLDRVGLYLQFDRPLEADELSAFRERVKRRASREPVQYILGRTEFWSLPFQVSPAVLIPRADTEVLVEEALGHAAPEGRILDVGTGSGILAVVLAHELPSVEVAAVDISPEALQLAEVNARENKVDGRIAFELADLADLPGEGWDMIVSNPPYIPGEDLKTLMEEVRDFEPRAALDGGADGLDAYRHLTRQARDKLSPGGWLLVEVGIGQAEEVRELFSRAGLSELFLRNDYAGVPRVVGGRNK